MITIQKAQSGDQEQIHTLASKVQIKNQNAPEKSGFLLYPKSPEKYLKRIKNTQHFYTAKEQDQIVGYLIANTLPELKKLNEDLPYLSVLESQGQDSIYLDQIAASPNHKGQSIGQKLLNHFLEKTNKQVLCFTVHEPVRNARSIRFFTEKNNFQLLKEVQFDNTTCGLYNYKNYETTNQPSRDHHQQL